MSTVQAAREEVPCGGCHSARTLVSSRMQASPDPMRPYAEQSASRTRREGSRRRTGGVADITECDSDGKVLGEIVLRQSSDAQEESSWDSKGVHKGPASQGVRFSSLRLRESKL
jgi:hypothetical protein